jgi:L-malate glycosyltransferase
MKVLYVERTGLVGGGERSLLSHLEALPTGIEAHLACPPGPLQRQAARRGVPTTTIAESVGSLRMHPVHTPLAVGAMGAASRGLLRAMRSWTPDVVHANSIRAGMIAAPASSLQRRPLVVHVRDCLPPSPITALVRSALVSAADAIVAISRHTATAFDPHARARSLRVIDNPFDLERFDPDRVDLRGLRAALGLPDRAPVLVLVGQITPWKGQEEAVRALADVRRRHPDVILLLVGEPKFTAPATRHDNLAYMRRLRATVRRLGLDDAVRFLGEREDIPEILRASDVALLPSWDEPFGRTVVEAMAMATPMVATALGGPAEVITDGVDGVLAAPRRPAEWAAAICDLLDDEPRRRAMGAAARRAAVARFGSERHATAIVALYRELVDLEGRRPGRRARALAARAHRLPVPSR